MKASDGITSRKSSEFYEEEKMKYNDIRYLKLELRKAIKCDLKILEKYVSLGKVKEGYSSVKSFKIRVTDWLSNFKRTVQELEDESENKKLSESNIFDAWLAKTRRFEEVKIELDESMLEIASICKKNESLDTSYNEESKNLIEKKVENNKFEFELVKGNENIAD
ncbi:hypothetical protein H5410_015081 [Solanum commersonii]|uniref:Uncharacterized protein n=1 Tax=Solanum commersonii TaxID=4109 RepID=A0A9J5ZSS6_SOLCO|nr:hypothetical protein H5410_015081 [Solanum commersonii]